MDKKKLGIRLSVHCSLRTKELMADKTPVAIALRCVLIFHTFMLINSKLL